jgi:hypothetical protein
MTLADETGMRAAIRHGNATLSRWGVHVMVFGGAFFVLPALLPTDDFAGTHETFLMASRLLWWQFAGVTVLFLGNTLRLIGTQGHPGLPWLFGRRPPHDVVAGLQLRRRAWENRAAALSGDLAPPILLRPRWGWRDLAPPIRWRPRWRLWVRVAARREAKRQGVPLPTCLRRASLAAAGC